VKPVSASPSGTVCSERLIRKSLPAVRGVRNKVGPLGANVLQRILWRNVPEQCGGVGTSDHTLTPVRAPTSTDLYRKARGTFYLQCLWQLTHHSAAGQLQPIGERGFWIDEPICDGAGTR
jgi:hypothetical protein